MSTSSCTSASFSCHLFNWIMSVRVFLTEQNVQKMFSLALEMKMNDLFNIFISFRLKFFEVTFTHKYFSKYLFLLFSAKIKKQKKFQRILSTNFFKHSPRASTFPRIRCLSFILFKLSAANLANVCIFHK